MRSDPRFLDDTDPTIIAQQSRELPPAVSEMGFAPRVPSVANLNLTVSNPPTQAEVQAIANKVDALLAAMRRAGHLVP